jgi:hypothetical protein
MDNLVELRLAVENEVLGENLPQRHFVHHKSHLPDPGVKPGHRGGKPAANRLSYGAALMHHEALFYRLIFFYPLIFICFLLFSHPSFFPPFFQFVHNFLFFFSNLSLLSLFSFYSFTSPSSASFSLSSSYFDFSSFPTPSSPLSDFSAVQPVASLYTDCTIPTLVN